MTADFTPTRAMVLAAGRGERLRPLTERTAKPLVKVDGKALLDWVLDRLAEAGIEEAVVNTHHFAAAIRDHADGRAGPRLTIVEEPELLDTGGGVANVLPLLGEGPLVVANSDIVLLNGVEPVVRRLARAWRGDEMAALLLVHPSVRAFGYEGRGDFMLAPDGRMRRRGEHEIAPYVFAGVQILHPGLFDDCPAGPFSLNRLYDRAESEGRLFGLLHDGEWMHVGTPEALARVERVLRLLS